MIWRQSISQKKSDKNEKILNKRIDQFIWKHLNTENFAYFRKMKAINVRKRDNMSQFFDREMKKIAKEIDKIKIEIRLKEMRQSELEKVLFQKVSRWTAQRVIKRNEIRQGIEILDRQIFYLNGRIVNYLRQIQVYMHLKDEEVPQI